MLVLGIAEEYGHTACALLKDGDILHTTETDIGQALQAAGINPADVESFCYFEKPVLRLERHIESYLANAPRAMDSFCTVMPELVRSTLFKKRDLVRRLQALGISSPRDKILFSDHITSLCAEAFYPAPHEQAAILCLDDAGEWAGTAVAIGDGNRITIERELPYPHSLGLLMAVFASYLNIRREDIGVLARQGQPTYARMMARSLIDLKQDGSFRINQIYVDYAAGGAWTTPALHDLLGGAPRGENEEISRKHCNIAASVMTIITQAVSQMVHMIARDYRGLHALCVTGRVANEEMVRDKIMRDHAFDHVDIRSDAGSRTLATGAALAGFYLHHGTPRDVMFHRNLPTAIAK